MARIQMTTHINAAPPAVFEAFADFRNAAARVQGITRIQVLTDGPIGVGTRFRETRVMFGKEATEEMQVIEFDPNRSYTLSCSSCGCEYRSTFRFAPNNQGTAVEMEMTARPISFFAKLMSPLMGLMMGRAMRKCVTQDVSDLKAALEKR